MFSKRFPIPISELEKWLPHRPPMVWIDEVISATPEGGECLIRLSKDALYMSPHGIRQSSLIEWVAQGYGYIRAAQRECGFLEGETPPTRVFLAGIREATYHLDLSGSSFTAGCVLHMVAKNIKVMKPLLLYDGTIALPGGQLIFEAKMRMFSQ